MTPMSPRWRIAADQVAPTPWRNGGGVTRELLRVDAPDGAARDAGEWLLRISLADIAADGPFSAFDGVTRWFAVIAGAGVRLRWPGHGAGSPRPGVEDLTPASAALEFDGGRAPGCTLLDGATRDLNVMVRTGAAQAVLLRADATTPWRWDGAQRGLFALRAVRLQRGGDGGSDIADSGASNDRGDDDSAEAIRHGLDLPPHTLAWFDDGDTSPWSLAETPPSVAANAQTAGSGAPAGWWIGLRHLPPAR